MNYYRDKMDSLQPTDSGSLRYWRSQARGIFANYPTVNHVEIIRSGRKTDSEVLSRGEDVPPAGTVVIIASTGGQWGRSRRTFRNPYDKGWQATMERAFL